MLLIKFKLADIEIPRRCICLIRVMMICSRDGILSGFKVIPRDKEKLKADSREGKMHENRIRRKR
jgi:hypothetical protein